MENGYDKCEMITQQLNGDIYEVIEKLVQIHFLQFFGLLTYLLKWDICDQPIMFSQGGVLKASDVCAYPKI